MINIDKKTKIIISIAIFILVVAAVITTFAIKSKNSQKIANIEVIGEMVKKEYYCGEAFDFYGLEIEYEIGGIKYRADWTDSDFRIENFDNEKCGVCSVKIIYKEQIVQVIDISVKAIHLTVYDNVKYFDEPIVLSNVVFGEIFDFNRFKTELGERYYNEYSYLDIYINNSDEKLSTFKVSGDATLQLIWKKSECKVSFDPDGGEGGIFSFSITTGRNLEAKSNAIRNGYEFIGWSTRKGDATAIISFPYKIENDVYFYAIWAKE